MRLWLIVCGVALSALAWRMAYAQDAPPPADNGKYVSRDEYEKLRKEMEAMRKEMEAMRKDQEAAAAAAKAAAQQAAAAAAQADKATAQADKATVQADKATSHVRTIADAQPKQSEIDQTLDDMDREIQRLKNQARGLSLGTTKLYIGGDMAIDYVDSTDAPSTFQASIAPLFLWKLSDRLLIEAGFDIGISTADDQASATSFDMTLANATYLVNKYITVGGGLFVVPFGVFHNHYDPPWINKLPDEPLPFGDNGIAPSSEVGFFVEGAFPIGSTILNYAVYVTNGPQLITNDPAAAGSLNFDDFTDLNNNKAVGGRIGFQPIRPMEVGYSIMASQPNPEGFKDVSALLQAVDFSYKQEIEPILGTIDFRTEWVWSNVETITYPIGTGLRFDNDRDGGYVQLSYRPTRVSNKILRNLEPVVRWDRLNIPASAPGGGWEKRWTLGLDYWLMPNAVLKVAYSFDDKETSDHDNTFWLEFGIGL